MRLALATAVLLATAASRGGCGRSAPYDACAGKTCGDTCHVCPPDATDCVEAAVATACDPAGSCSPLGTFACGVAEACAGKACGAACTVDPPCLQSSPPCMMPSYAGHCDASGACVATEVSCTPPVSDCAGQPCGTACTLCDPTGSTPCVPGDGVCDVAGRCVLGTPETACYDPCAGKACHDACDPCPPGMACPATMMAFWCDGAGACVPQGWGAACP